MNDKADRHGWLSANRNCAKGRAQASDISSGAELRSRSSNRMLCRPGTCLALAALGVLCGWGTAAFAQATTTTVLSSSTNTPAFGQSILLTATVANTNAAGAVPTGTVNFVDNFGGNMIVVCTGVPLTAGTANATATCNYTPAAAGTHDLVASYAPDTDIFAASTTSPLVVTVSRAATTTTLALSAPTAPAGTAVTLTATVAWTGGPATPGLVRFCNAAAPRCADTAILATAQLNAQGTAAVKLELDAGMHSLTAAFAGTKTFVASTSTTSTLTVTGKRATNTTFTSSAANPYTLTASVSGSIFTPPTGFVDFVDTTYGNSLAVNIPLTGGTVTPGFKNPAPNNVGPTPTAVVAADFNGDGIPDLASVSPGDSALNILLGKGDGTFNAAASTTLGDGVDPVALAVGDFNGDGIPDIAVAVENSGVIDLFQGVGDGTFTESVLQVNFGDGTPLFIAVGDFNGDGNQDLAVADENVVEIYIGNGDGTFGQNTFISTTVTENPIAYLAVADFNGDGNLDVATANTSNGTVTVLFGDGTGAFPTSSTLQTGSQTFSVVEGDFNGDGIPDIAAANQAGNDVVVYLGNSSGGFTLASTVTTGAAPESIAVADFNGDGVLDLVTANQGAQTVTVLFGKGDGTFPTSQTEAVLAPAAAPPGPLYVATADLNHDGQPDIVTANGDSTNPGTGFIGTLSVVLGNATITSTATAANIFVTPPGTHEVEATYSGDANFSSSTSIAGGIQGAAVATVTALTANIFTPAFGQAIVLTATVSNESGTGTAPIGAVNFVDAFGANAISACSAVVLSAGPAIGTAVCVYTPATAGIHAISATYVPSSNEFSASVPAELPVTVSKGVPVVSWMAPAPLVVGTPLSAAQLDATATGVTGAFLPGTFAYTPAAGSLVQAGTQTLSVLFTPADGTDYATATASVQLTGTNLTVSSVSPATASLGDPAKTVVLTGTGFLSNSAVEVNGTAVATTSISGTKLSAVIPATYFKTVQTLTITVFDPTQNQTTGTPVTLPVTAPPVHIAFVAPAMAAPGEQPEASLQLTNPYPADLAGTITLTFAAASGDPDDPAIQFDSGGRTLSFTIPALTTVTPSVRFQSGTVAGTITLTLDLLAGGIDVTPASVQPVGVDIPMAVPSLTSITYTQSGDTVTVSMLGFSNTRQATQAHFHFVAATGETLDNSDVTVPVNTIYATWYGSAASDQYGSGFLYTQIFTLSSNATISQITATLDNEVGTSPAASSP